MSRRIRVFIRLVTMLPYVGILGAVVGIHMNFEGWGQPPAGTARLGLSYTGLGVLASYLIGLAAALGCRPWR